MRIEHLDVTFATDSGDVEAVSDVNLYVIPGEILAIVGDPVPARLSPPAASWAFCPRPPPPGAIWVRAPTSSVVGEADADVGAATRHGVPEPSSAEPGLSDLSGSWLRG